MRRVTEPGDRDERISALEARLGRVGIRGELRDFRDHNNRVLNAMRGDLVDLREHVDRGFARVDEQFAQTDRNFLGIRAVLDAQAAGQQQIVALLESLVRQGGDDQAPPDGRPPG